MKVTGKGPYYRTLACIQDKIPRHGNGFLSCSVLDKYAVRFIPRENGLYLIDVKFNGSHIPGSPFKIRVGETGQAGDPGMVSAYGAGLEGGVTGKCLVFNVLFIADQICASPPPHAGLILAILFQDLLVNSL